MAGWGDGRVVGHGGRPTSSNAYACGAHQNTGNYMSDIPSTRVAQQPGGNSTFSLGWSDPPSTIASARGGGGGYCGSGYGCGGHGGSGYGHMVSSPKAAGATTARLNHMATGGCGFYDQRRPSAGSPRASLTGLTAAPAGGPFYEPRRSIEAGPCHHAMPPQHMVSNVVLGGHYERRPSTNWDGPPAGVAGPCAGLPIEMSGSTAGDVGGYGTGPRRQSLQSVVGGRGGHGGYSCGQEYGVRRTSLLAAPEGCGGYGGGSACLQPQPSPASTYRVASQQAPQPSPRLGTRVRQPPGGASQIVFG